MNRILVVGPTYITEEINLRGTLESGGFLPAEIKQHPYGGSYSIAYNATVLGVDTCLITRMANDEIANLMYINLDKTNGIIFSNNSILKNTPRKIFISDNQGHQTVIDNLDYDIHPNIKDGYPTAAFESNDYGIVNIINSKYLLDLISRFPALKWVSENNIPADSLLSRFAGVVIEKDYFEMLVRREEKSDYITHLLQCGLQWLIITDGAKEVTLYSGKGVKTFSKENQGTKTLGLHEVFTSMLLACLANDFSLQDSIEHGLNIANDMSYQEDICLNKKLYGLE